MIHERHPFDPGPSNPYPRGDQRAEPSPLRERHGIEIGAGVGQYAATVWRIGLMGHNARPDDAFLVLAALEEAITA